VDRKKEEFLAKLRETFRVEASEHIEAIRAGLLAVERATESERASVVERIFRAAHSFKGAARSVSLAGVEALCRELESIFAVMKRGELSLSTAMLDAIHSVLGVLDVLCASPDAPQPSEVSDRQQHALATLKRIARGMPVDETETSASHAVAETSRPQGIPQVIPATGDAVLLQEAPMARAAATETVRVSTHKLAAIVLETEELVGAKLAVLEHANELTKVAGELTAWNQQRIRRKGASGSSVEDRTSRTEGLETELLYTRKLESSLRRLAGAVNQDARSLGAIADRVIEDTKKVSMLPCSHLLGAFPTMLRDLAREQGKEADFVFVGEDIEVDRRVLDELKAPLIHLLRNCVDHGIEKPGVRKSLGKTVRATVTMTVRAVGGTRIELTVADDGAGIDIIKVSRAAVRLGLVAEDDARATASDVNELIFHSGLSTSPIITDLSGRGLGLAIVRETVELLGGSLSVTSAPGTGTTFRMLVPMSLATFRGVFVDAAGCRFVIPTTSVLRVGRIKPVDIKTVENRQTIALGDRAVSLVRLRDLLSLSGPDHHLNGAPRPVVVVRTGDRQIALLVDDVHGEQEVMVRSLGQQLVRVRHIAGATISTSGVVIPILNVSDLAESASTVGAPGPADMLLEAASERRRRLLVAEDSITARTLVKSILEAAGYQVAVAVDGVDALTKLKTESFDLVVSDVDMPRMNGFELTTKIRADKKLGELPVVLVTALRSQSDREYGIDVGANAYIVKSEFDQGNLLEIVRRLL
jgi:two-component system, chemotaxis family, sensor kinase CheA